MAPHEEILTEVPAYLRGDLDDDASHRMQEHIASCDECHELVEGMALVTGEMRAYGSTLFEPHPEVAELRAAADGGADVTDRIRRHVALCAPCDVELQYWKRQRVATGRPGAAAARTVWRWGLPLAAGILLGVGVDSLWRSVSDRGSAGLVDVPVLYGTLRSDDQVARLALQAGQPAIALSLALHPEGAVSRLPDDARVRLEIHDGTALTHLAQFDGEELKRRIASTGLLTVMVPAGGLDSGRHRLTLREEGVESPLFTSTFELSR